MEYVCPLCGHQSFSRCGHPELVRQLQARKLENSDLCEEIKKLKSEKAALEGLQQRNEGRVKEIVDDKLIRDLERARKILGAMPISEIASWSGMSYDETVTYLQSFVVPKECKPHGQPGHDHLDCI